MVNEQLQTENSNHAFCWFVKKKKKNKKNKNENKNKNKKNKKQKNKKCPRTANCPINICLCDTSDIID